MKRSRGTVERAQNFFREYTAGLNTRDLQRLFERDAARAYAVLTREHSGAPEPKDGFNRFLHRAKLAFLGLSYKLTPPRRLLFAVSLLAFLNVTKYPPSLAYVAMTLGPALLALAAVERARGAAHRFLVTLGRVPLFFYVLHIVLVHGMALLIGVAQGHPAAAFARDFLHRPDGFGFGLPVVYAAWLAALALLYAPSRWFAGVKRRSRSTWLSYL